MEDIDKAGIAIGSAVAGAAVTAGLVVNQPIAGVIIGVIAGFFLSSYSAIKTKGLLSLSTYPHDSVCGCT